MSKYSGSRLSEVQEPHPPPRKQGGGYDVPHVIRKRYILTLRYPTFEKSRVSCFYMTTPHRRK